MDTQTHRSALHFEVVRTLAQTAQCEVLLVGSGASHQVWKILRHSAAANPEALGRFMDEAVVCQRLSHPGVVRSVGAGRLPDGRLYLATEYLEGVTLAEHLETRGPLAPDHALRLFASVCDALAYMHRQGILHRDLRPGNLFLCGGLEAFRPKIIDFGLANFRGTRSFQTSVGAAVLPRAEYCAPECVRGHQADPRSDLYALGVTMYEALTGAPPFQHPDHATLLMKHLREVPPALPASCEVLAPIIRRCLEKEPHQRFESATAVLKAMGEFGVLPAPREDSAEDTSFDRGEKIGDRLGEHEIIELIGEGAMGRVFLARRTSDEQLVAIKVLKPEQAQDPALVQRFFNEVRLVKAVRHPHIVEVHDLVDETLPSGRRRIGCVMEALRGVDLAEAMERAPLSIPRAVRIIRQLCSALATAHQAGVVHRDIKPDNIFLEQREGDDFVKVLDFGVAKLVGGDDLDLIDRSLAGLIIGTLAYMAPEQAGGKEVDARADVYSVGIILYQLLSGAVPFHGASFLDTAVKIAKELPPPLPDLSVGGELIPNRLKGIVVRCLEKDPLLRFPSAQALSDALSRFDQATETEAEAKNDRMPRTLSDDDLGFELPRRSRAPLVGLALASVFVVGGAFALIQASGSTAASHFPSATTHAPIEASAAASGSSVEVDPGAGSGASAPRGETAAAAAAERAAPAATTAALVPAAAALPTAAGEATSSTAATVPLAQPAGITQQDDLSNLLVAPSVPRKASARRGRSNSAAKAPPAPEPRTADLGRDDLMNPYGD